MGDPLGSPRVAPFFFPPEYVLPHYRDKSERHVGKILQHLVKNNIDVCRDVSNSPRSGICQILQHLVKYHKLLVRSLLKRNIDEFRDVFFEGEGRI